MYTYDVSQPLQLALVATEKLREPQYVPLDQAPYPRRSVDSAYLRQLHAVANGVAIGPAVASRMPFEPMKWEVAGACLAKR
jgi:hypothetical protein